MRETHLNWVRRPQPVRHRHVESAQWADQRPRVHLPLTATSVVAFTLHGTCRQTTTFVAFPSSSPNNTFVLRVTNFQFNRNYVLQFLTTSVIHNPAAQFKLVSPT